MKIRKDDKVVVLSGRDKGKEGKVLSVDPKAGKVIVEGVEERWQVEILRKYGCDMIQGYYYSKPIEINQFCQKFFPGSAICGCL